ncbi:MAG: TIGR04255 family protein [Planctomycetota bacterium]
MSTPQTPLSGPPPAEVPLSTPPLVRVIAQVRFPVIASVEKREFIAPFQEAIREEYPVLRPEQSRSVVLGPDGVRDARATMAWRFHDLGSDWRVALAPDFVALETGRYSSRDDFLARFRSVLAALEEHVDPKVVDRLGVRYIDRVMGPNLLDLPTLVRPEVSGILSTPLSGAARHAFTEQLFVLPDEPGLVTAKWGLVPGRSTVDPAAVEPIEEPSWLLDLDAFQAFQGDTRAFDVDAMVAQSRSFAERIYSIFRWAVTDEFLRRYGGQP